MLAAGLAIAIYTLSPPPHEWHASYDWWKAADRFVSVCRPLGPETTGELQDALVAAYPDVWSKPPMLRSGRRWCRDQGLGPTCDRCVGAVVSIWVQHNIEIHAGLEFEQDELNERLEQRALDSIMLSEAEHRYAIKARRLGQPTLYLPSKLSVGAIGEFAKAIHVNQVIDLSTVLATYNGKTIMLTDVLTTRVVDGDRITPSGIYEVTGTTQYTTVVGALSTVYLVESPGFDRDAIARWASPATRRLLEGRRRVEPIPVPQHRPRLRCDP